MDIVETRKLETEINGLRDELRDGRIALTCRHPPYNSPDTPRPGTLTSLSHSICEIRCVIHKLFWTDPYAEKRGVKLIESILQEIKSVCNINQPFVDSACQEPFHHKEENLSHPLSNCLDEAYDALTLCKTLRRCVPRPNESSGNTSQESAKSVQRRQNADQAKMRKFISKTSEDASELYYYFFGSNLLGEDENFEQLDKTMWDNEQHRLLYIAGKSIQRCTASLSEQKSALSQIVNELSVSDDQDAVLSMTDYLKRIRDNVFELSKNLKEAEKEMNALKDARDEKDKENNLLLSSCEQTKQDLVELQTKFKTLQKEKDDCVLQNKKLLRDGKELEKKQNEVTRLNEELTKCRTRCKQLEGDLHQVQDELTEAQRENSELLQRLSQSMSTQITFNNPNVADLSDPNRPAKLAEQYSELYDNEWTDAFQTMKSYQLSENIIVGRLLHILNQAYAFCGESGRLRMVLMSAALVHPSAMQLKRILSLPLQERPNGCQFDECLSKEELQVFTQMSKQNQTKAVENLKQDFLQLLKEGNWLYMDPSACKSYIEKCVDLCWGMTLQTPPIVIESSFDDTETFDTKKYRFYQKSGKRYNYIVWPVMYLHKDGPILTQGVAEPKP